MLKSKTERALLFAFSQVRELDYLDIYSVAHALGVEKVTVEKRMSRLVTDGYVLRKKSYGRKYLILSKKGERELDDILEDLDHDFLTPERHGILTNIKLVEIMDKVSNPFLKVFLYSIFNKWKRFDLIETLQSISVFQNETSMINMIKEKERTRGPTRSFVESFMDLTLYGKNIDETVVEEEMSRDRSRGALVHAEVMLKNGNLDSAIIAYDKVSRMKNAPHDVWLIAVLGKIRTHAKKGEIERMKEEIEKAKLKTKDQIALAYMDQIVADIYSSLGEYEKAESLFESCIKIFNNENNYLYSSIAFGNYGVLFYNKNEYDEAESKWTKSRYYAEKAGSSYVYSLANLNLTSIDRKKGRIRKAEKRVNEIKQMNIKKYYPGLLSSITYIESLIEISKGNPTKACSLYNKSMKIANPFITKIEIEEKKKMFENELEKSGFL